jgi:hypothetical protein
MRVYLLLIALLVAALALLATPLLVDDPEHETWWNSAGWMTWEHTRYRAAFGKSLDYPMGQFQSECLGRDNPNPLVRAFRRVTPANVCSVEVGDCSLPGDCPIVHKQYLACVAYDTSWLSNLVGRRVGCIPVNPPK